MEIQKNLQMLREKEQMVQKLEAERAAQETAAREANDTAVLARLDARITELLKGNHHSSGNTLRLKETNRAIVNGATQWCGTYRLKATIRGHLMGMSEAEIKTHVRSLIQKEMKDIGMNVYVGLTKYEVVKNWWRGGFPGFYEYDAQMSEDTFNCIALLGTPLITRPLAYLYDRWFPRIRVKIWFNVYTPTV